MICLLGCLPPELLPEAAGWIVVFEARPLYKFSNIVRESSFRSSADELRPVRELIQLKKNVRKLSSLIRRKAIQHLVFKWICLN